MNANEVSLKEVELLTVRVLDDQFESKDMERLSVLLESSASALSLIHISEPTRPY